MVNNITILYPFLSRPYEKIHLAEISKITGIPHPTARLWLIEFEKQGILRKETKGRLSLFYLNFDHPNIIDYLIVAEKTKLLEKCKDLIIKEIRDYFNKEECTVIMFGSAVDDIKKANDIDLALIGKYDHESLKKFSDHINKDIHTVNSGNFANFTETTRKEILKKHIFVNICEKTVKELFGAKNSQKG